MSRKIKRSAAFSDALFELDSYRNAVNRATFYERKLNETREQLVLPSGSDIVVDGGERKDLAEKFDKVQEFMAKFYKQWVESLELMQKIEQRINCVQSPYNIILRKRYIECKKFVNIAVEMFYNDEAYTQRVNKTGINLYAKMWLE